ncbi:MAG TPA: YdcF family protein [Nitrospirae bacterium]|nr:YdcF family protein [Nitrospirota bacterium]
MSEKSTGILTRIYRFTRALFAMLGILFFIMIVSAVTGYYGHGTRWLASAEYSPDCDYILLLPAGAIPSPTMLMRAYKAASEWKKNPSAKIIISHLTKPPLLKSTIWSIRNELVFRGVDAKAILLEKKATNTGEHAKYIKEAGFGDPEKDKYLIVTSPTHIKRSVMAFKAVGFKHVYAAGAVGKATKEYLGGGRFIRYNVWYSLMHEIEMVREFVAIGFYILTGRA